MLTQTPRSSISTSTGKEQGGGGSSSDEETEGEETGSEQDLLDFVSDADAEAAAAASAKKKKVFQQVKMFP